MSSRACLLFLLAVLVAVVLAGTAAPQRAEAEPAMNRTERAVARLVNAVRLREGLRPLGFSPALARAADTHSIDIAKRRLLDHDGADGTSMRVRVRRFVPSVRSVGETIALVGRGRSAAAMVVRLWMASPPHRAVILTPHFSRIGIGARAGHRRALFVTADFSTRR